MGKTKQKPGRSSPTQAGGNPREDAGSDEAFRILVENSLQGLTVIQDGSIVYANTAISEITGFTREEIFAHSWEETVSYIHPEDRERAIANIGKLLAGGPMDSYQKYRIFHRDGSVRWVETLNGTTVFAGKPAIQVVYRDITNRVRAEEERALLEAQLRQAQKLESVGTLAGGVAHEIMNPVSIMMNFARLIQEKSGDESPIRGYAQEIVDEGDRISGIVRKLLAFAREERETHSPARIVDVVRSTVDLMSAILGKDSIRLEVDVPEDLPSVNCRSQQIQQVLVNLLTNARDSLNERYPGRDPDKVVSIASRAVERAGETWVSTIVEDHGIGIEPENLGRVFDPFFTTKPRDKGTGLGLSVSYGIVREHGGEMRVESGPGRYARFHMDLKADDGGRD